MLSHTQTINFCNFQRSITFLSHHLQLKFHHYLPPQTCKVSKCRNDDCDEFLPWLENKAGVQISSFLSIGNSDKGRSLFACKSIEAGDCLLKVPFIVQISPDNILPEIKPLLDANVVNPAVKLAVVILAEQKKGQSSEWAPYMSCLPQHGELHSTIFWSKKELQMIKQSSLYWETINQEAQITEDYLAVKPVFDRFPERFEDVDFENFKHAYGLVVSRAWESVKGQSLIPFADFLNHDGVSEPLISYEKEQVSEVIADRDYAPGEEVLIRYGKFPNSTLLLDFGFTIPCNTYDQVCIQIDIPYDDHLREMKSDLLKKYCFPKIKDAGFSLPGFCFVIKEVRSLRGKGKGIPPSLRGFARVLCCTSSQELNELAMEAVQHDGRLARRPLVKRGLEIQAHEFLLSLVDELIENYYVSIQSLNVQEAAESRKFAIRRQMAHDLLTGELRVLRSASAWLKNYCQSYREQGKTILKS